MIKYIFLKYKLSYINIHYKYQNKIDPLDVYKWLIGAISLTHSSNT